MAKATTNRDRTKSSMGPRKVKVKVVRPRKVKEKARTNPSMQQDVVFDASSAISAFARTLITRRSTVIQAIPIGSMTTNLNQTKSLTWPRKVKVKAVRPRKVREKARTKVRRRKAKAKASPMKMVAKATTNLSQTKSLTRAGKEKVKVVRPRKVKEKVRTRVRRRKVKAKVSSTKIMAKATTNRDR